MFESTKELKKRTKIQLLREVKLKESVTEKKLKDVEEGLMNQVISWKTIESMI